MIRILLSRGKTALVDDQDAELAKKMWSALQTRTGFYAVRSVMKEGKSRFLYLHREVMKAKKGQRIDHKNGDGLDCRRSNLRVATNSQNLHNRGPQKNNRSGYKGVLFDKSRNLWRAEITVRGVRRHIGRFRTSAQAARAYDKEALALHGDFSKLNFPTPKEG